MSTVVKQYVEATAETLALSQEPAKVIKDLRAVLVRRGHEKLLRRVLKGLAEKLAVREKIAAPRLTVAKSEDAKKLSALAKGALLEVDPSIIGGYILTQNHRRTDQSYKRRLLNWFERAIRD